MATASVGDTYETLPVGNLEILQVPTFVPEQWQYLRDLIAGKLAGPDKAMQYYNAMLPEFQRQETQRMQALKSTLGPRGSLTSAYPMGVDRIGQDMARVRAQSMAEALWKERDREAAMMSQIPQMSPIQNVTYWNEPSYKANLQSGGIDVGYYNNQTQKPKISQISTPDFDWTLDYLT